MISEVIFILIGVFFIFVASVGVLRLPDFFCRSHALTKAMTMGITLILIGAWLNLGSSKIGIKVCVALIFQYLTIPISGHILGRVAYRKNIARYKHKSIDDHRIKG